MADDAPPNDPGPPAGATSVHVRRACAGDQEAITWLVQHLTPILLARAQRLLPRRLRGACGPQDLVQDVWIEVLPKLPYFEPKHGGRWTPPLLAYLLETLERKALNLLRRANKQAAHKCPLATEQGQDGAPPAAPEPADAGPLPWELLLEKERNAAVRAALDRLAPKDREILHLRFFEGLGNKEAARVLGISEKAASKRHARALERLKVLLCGGASQGLTP